MCARRSPQRIEPSPCWGRRARWPCRMRSARQTCAHRLPLICCGHLGPPSRGRQSSWSCAGGGCECAPECTAVSSDGRHYPLRLAWPGQLALVGDAPVAHAFHVVVPPEVLEGVLLAQRPRQVRVQSESGCAGCRGAGSMLTLAHPGSCCWPAQQVGEAAAAVAGRTALLAQQVPKPGQPCAWSAGGAGSRTSWGVTVLRQADWRWCLQAHGQRCRRRTARPTLSTTMSTSDSSTFQPACRNSRRILNLSAEMAWLSPVPSWLLSTCTLKLLLRGWAWGRSGATGKGRSAAHLDVLVPGVPPVLRRPVAQLRVDGHQQVAAHAGPAHGLAPHAQPSAPAAPWPERSLQRQVCQAGGGRRHTSSQRGSMPVWTRWKFEMAISTSLGRPGLGGATCTGAPALVAPPCGCRSAACSPFSAAAGPATGAHLLQDGLQLAGRAGLLQGPLRSPAPVLAEERLCLGPAAP